MINGNVLPLRLFRLIAGLMAIGMKRPVCIATA